MKNTIIIKFDPKHPKVGKAVTTCENMTACLKALDFYRDYPERIQLSKKTVTKNRFISFGKRLGFLLQAIKTAFCKDFSKCEVSILRDYTTKRRVDNVE